MKVLISIQIYPEVIIYGFKNEGREVNKALNVAIQESSKMRIFIGKGKEEKEK